MPQYGNWKEVRKLGRGSFGTVYEIEQTDELGFTTRSALKAIRIPQSETQLDELRSKGETEDAVAEYFREMAVGVSNEIRTMYRLKGHTNIVSYEDHQIRLCEDNISWELLIRMELLTPLRQYVSDHSITRKTVIKLGIDICNALERCQKFNIIHRDIKPGNILVSENGDFKLSDFGIARRVSEDATLSALSQKGTFTYMAPEIYMGKGYGFSVDLYSLGIVMYQLLNHNRDPFLPPYPERIHHGDHRMSLNRRMGGEAFPYPAEDRGQLAEIILKACRYDPESRYSSPRQMREDLEAVLYTEADWKQVMETHTETLVIPGSDRVTASSSAHTPEIAVSSAQEEGNGDGEALTQQEADHAQEGELTFRLLRTVPTPPENTENTEELSDRKDPTLLLSGTDAEAESEEESVPEAEDGPPENAEESLSDEGPAMPTDSDEGPAVPTEQEEEQQTSEPEEPEPDPTESGEGEDTDTSTKRSVPVKAVAVLLVLLLVVVGGLGWRYLSTTSVVPDVTLMSQREAEEALEAVSLVTEEEEWVHSDEVERGCVVSVSSMGKRVAKNTGVTLTLSLGSVVTVPNEVGAEGEDAEAALKTLGLTVSTETDYSDDYAEGLVMAQSLDAETDVDEGTEIVLTLSLGSKPFELASYKGQTLEDAKAALEALGLTVETKKGYSSEIASGSVMKQSPAAGEQVRKGDTVTLKISQGPEQVVVPDVTGMTVSEATAALEAVGLTLGSTTNVYSSYTSSGYITEQGTAAGTEVDIGSSVSVNVSIGPKPTSSSSSSSSSKKSSSSSSSKKSSSSSSSNSTSFSSMADVN